MRDENERSIEREARELQEKQSLRETFANFMKTKFAKEETQKEHKEPKENIAKRKKEKENRRSKSAFEIPVNMDMFFTKEAQKAISKKDTPRKYNEY